MSSETPTTAPTDQWGRTLPVPARSIAFLDGNGLASPALTAGDGTLTLAVPAGATRLRVQCAAKALRLGLSDSTLTEDTAGAYVEFAAGVWFEVYVVSLSTIKLRTSDGTQQTIQFSWDTLA